MSKERDQNRKPVQTIERVQVDPDDIFDLIIRNNKERPHPPSNTGVLRITPPFETVERAEKHLKPSDSHFPAGRTPTPVHLNPTTFLDVQAADFRSPPTWSGTRADIQTEIEKESPDDDVVSQLLEEGREVWRHDMRRLLVDSIELGDHEVAVEYVGSEG